MLRSLVDVTLRGMFSGQFRATRRGRFNLPGPLRVLLVIALYCYIGWAIGFSMFRPLADQMYQVDMPELYFAVIGLYSVLLSVFVFMISAQNIVFNAKDNDFLFSMPLSPRLILSARLISQFLFIITQSALLLIPAAIAYWRLSPPAPLQVVFFLIGSLLLSCLSLTVSLLVGWVMAFFSGRLRNKNLITLVLSITFFAVYFFAVGRMNEWINRLVAEGRSFYAALSRVFYPVAGFAEATVGAGIMPLFLLALVTLIPLAVCIFILSIFFVRIVTRNPGQKKVVYSKKAVRVRSVLGTLLSREWSHYFSNALVLLNTALGAIMFLFLAGYILIAPGSIQTILSQMNFSSDIILYLLIPVQAFILSTSAVTASSISIEGRTFWFLRSLPISPGTILLSKIIFHVTVIWPPLFLSTLAALIVFGGSVSAVVASILIPFLFLLFIAQTGLLLNLRFHRFDYVSDLFAVKQSMSVILTMISGWMFVGISFFAVLQLDIALPCALFMAGVLLVLLNAILALLLKGRGICAFERAGSD